MAFFRIKKVKGKEYAYIVENEWKRKSSRQKVKAYLGRVHRFELKNNVDLAQFLKTASIEDYINDNPKNKIINDLIEWELFKHGISKHDFLIDFDNMEIQKNKKNIAVFINDGFVCNATLKNLLEFKPEGDEETDGYRLARAFVEAGVKVPQEAFVGLCQKLFKV